MVKKGWMAVQVGLDEEDEDCQKFEIPITYLYHPLFANLLDKAREVYGYYSDGPLKLPCSVDDFLDLKWRIEKESSNHHHQQHHNHPLHVHHFSHALSFRSC
ncbi:hypothetical protein SOVF_206780 [Spinacia oleracea]|uniref:Auxin-responsive protein SAUR32 n=1 Tax=Spinacia oleracea TaxID=3562 RepID=A0ABM3RP05_SPIOL|nr:auxin-responsive protein SAUR32-like [Spinacia oleracea]KNA03681.1 hypothetical protein SOVF_206780 [Spinacia oleracea]